MRGSQHLKHRNKQILDYICDTFVEEDALLRQAKNRTKEAGLPQIMIPKKVGKLLYFLTKMHQPKRILEIGTLGGYSTLWLAKGAPNAEIITIESQTSHANVAIENLKAFESIQVLIGNANQILPTLKPAFDLIFLDADKAYYTSYLPHLLRLSNSGALLLTDNLIPKKGNLDPDNPSNTGAKHTFEFNEMLANHPNIDTVLVPTIVGKKGRVDALGVSFIGDVKPVSDKEHAALASDHREG